MIVFIPENFVKCIIGMQSRSNILEFGAVLERLTHSCEDFTRGYTSNNSFIRRWPQVGAESDTVCISKATKDLLKSTYSTFFIDLNFLLERP